MDYISTIFDKPQTNLKSKPILFSKRKGCHQYSVSADISNSVLRISASLLEVIKKQLVWNRLECTYAHLLQIAFWCWLFWQHALVPCTAWHICAPLKRLPWKHRNKNKDSVGFSAHTDNPVSNEPNTDCFFLSLIESISHTHAIARYRQRTCNFLRNDTDGEGGCHGIRPMTT